MKIKGYDIADIQALHSAVRSRGTFAAFAKIVGQKSDREQRQILSAIKLLATTAWHEIRNHDIELKIVEDETPK